MGRKEKTIFITLIANIILIVLRFFLAKISGSIGLEANAWHSFTDVFVTSVVFAGLMAARHGTEKLRLASKKLEHLLAIFVSVFIFIMGIEILSDALSGEQTELKYVPFVAAAAFVGVAINYFMARYKIYVGEQTGSSSLIADGYHSKMDMYCSIAVLVGIVGSLFGMPDLDKISAVVAMVLLMISGYEIFTSNLSMLLHPEMEQRTDVHMGHVHGFHGNKKMIAGIAGVLTAAYLLSGIYFVGLDETGVVRRFGAVVNEKVTPGIHYRLPAPFEEVSIIKSDNVQKIEVGVQELLTGDTNLVNVNLVVNYRINDTLDYVLNVSDAELLIQSGATTSIRKIQTYRVSWPIAYKARPFTLSSDIYGYEVEVEYWMPFVYGQGLHDADWQDAFGGELYKTKGSHGCINLPKEQAKIIYDTIEAGYPIIIY